jgi:excisionase family DNA binding protein
MPDPRLTVEEASERLGKAESTVWRRVSKAELSGTKVGRQWLVDAKAALAAGGPAVAGLSLVLTS